MKKSSGRRATSVDEELRATLEQLEATKDELERMNQELRSAEREERGRVEELDQLYSELAHLFRATEIATLFLDRKLRILRFTPRTADIYSIREVDIGRPLLELSSQLEYPELPDDARSVIEELAPIERQLEDRNGRTYLVRILPYRDRDDRMAGVVATFVDITLIKEAEQEREQLLDELRRAEARASRLAEERKVALEESEQRFRHVAAHVADVFALHDRRRREFIYVNPAFEHLTGCPARELVGTGQRWLTRVHPDDKERVAAAYELMMKGDPLDEEFRILRPDGGVRWVRARNFPMAEKSRHAARDVVTVQNITSERALEEELRQAHKLEAVGALASGVAHDFNNVLQSILGSVGVALDEPTLPDHVRKFLEQAAGAARRGGGLADQLTSFARRDCGDIREVYVDALIERSAAMIDRLTTESVALKIDCNAPGMLILADEVRMEQLMLNLAANARDAMPEGGVLSISTDVIDSESPFARRHRLSRTRRHLRITVADTGIGMDDETRERMFEPFFTAKPVGRGTGLGLATVFSVTRELRGHVDVDTAPGRGTTFCLSFPCHEGAPADIEPPQADEHRFHGTALLVEDEPVVRMALRHDLEQLGLAVLEAGDGDDALTLCEMREGLIDVLISDVVLPTTQGPQLSELVQQRYPGVKTLFISANPEFVGDHRAIEETSVLRKPFQKHELAASLRGLLKTSPGDGRASKAHPPEGGPPGPGGALGRGSA